MLPPLVNRFVAGTTIEESVDYAEDLYEETGIKPIVNLLGEHYTEKPLVYEDVEEYKLLTNELDKSSIPGPTVSVKPSQLGIDISPKLFESCLEEIITESNCRVWVDMESYDTFHSTVDIVTQLAENYPGSVGLCLQANIKDTESVIVETIAGLPMDIRLVKGAYAEDDSIAYQGKNAIDESYKSCIKAAFEAFSGTPTGLAVGTHHNEMIEFSCQLQSEYQLEHFEVQMLMGVREEKQQEVALNENVEMYQYIPFGSEWFSYFYRRVREKKENALFALRAVLGV